jgi:putative transposase
MPRNIRFIPEGGALVEVTDRTVQARFLLVPSPELNEILLGVLGRAQRLYQVRICGFVAMSNHVHLLLRVEDAFQLASFMGYFASNLAREIARLTGWTDKIWARRYQAIVISDEEAAQTARFAYLLAHGVKEGLVEHAKEWPGAHCVRNLLDGEPIEGTWFDRTQESSARIRGKTIHARQFATSETVILSPLPCWEHLSEGAIRERVAALVQKVEEEAAVSRAETASEVLGAAAVRVQKAFDRPARPKRSPAPLIHAFARRVRRELYEAYHLFLAAFRDAADRLRSGDRNARFPMGSFPPGLPFVSALAPQASG